jgi:hypothetical protein
MKKHNSEEAFYSRLRNLAEVNKVSVKESQTRNLGTLIDYKRAADGIAYGIIKEQHHYYIKKAGLKQDPDISDFAYIGGLGNITEYQFQKLSEADKQRSMLLNVILESSRLRPNPNGGKKRLNEDKAGEEIDQAEEKLGDLDTAVAAEIPTEPVAPEAEMDAGLEAEPSAPEGGEGMPAPEGEPAPEGGEGMPAPEGGEGEPAPEGGEEMPAPEGGEGEPAPEGDEEAMADDAIATPEDEKSLTVQEIEKNLGKLTEKIRKTDLEAPQIKSYLKSFITAFKNKIRNIEIEERKEIADLILKVVPADEIEDVSATVPQDNEAGVEEGICAECGSFAQYAESRGYTKESIAECGDEELGNLIGGYATAHGEGQNDGDFDNVALYANDAIMECLKEEYGHEEYINELAPFVNTMNESSDEDKQQKIDELWGGLKSLGKAAGGAIGGGLKKAGQAVAGAAKAGAEKVGQAGQAIKQQYYKGEVNPAYKKLQDAANELSKQINNLVSTTKKAGQTPPEVQQLLNQIVAQISAPAAPAVGKSGKPMNVAAQNAWKQGQTAKTTAGQVKMAAEGVIDPGNVEVQPNMLKEDDEIEKDLSNPEETPEFEAGEREEEKEISFAPEAQSLGVVTAKPNDTTTTDVDINISPDKTVNISMNEAKHKLIKQIAESVNTYLNEMNKTAGKGKPFINTPKNVKEGNLFTAQLAKTPKGEKFEIGGKKMKDISNYDKVNETKKSLDEKWAGDVDVKKTGEHAGKSVEQVNKELAAIKKRNEARKEKGEKETAADKEQRAELQFAKRAKQGWKESVEKKPVMNEVEQKLRKYIRARIEEKVGLRKSVLTESKKSETLKKLDELINKQFNLFETSMKERGVITEEFWAKMKSAFQSNAQKFENLDQSNPEAIEAVFTDVFKDTLNGRFKIAKQNMANKMSPEVKYAVMKQGYETEKLRNPDFIEGGPTGYQYKPLNLENPFAGGGTGGKMHYGGSTGT